MSADRPRGARRTRPSSRTSSRRSRRAARDPGRRGLPGRRVRARPPARRRPGQGHRPRHGRHGPDAAARRGRVRVRLASARAVRALRHGADPRPGLRRRGRPRPRRALRPRVAQPRRPSGDARGGRQAPRLHGERALPDARRRGDRHHRPGARPTCSPGCCARRWIPAETFAEDPLRMYRAARFVARLGFALAPGTIEAMRAQAARTSILSVERVSDEIRRLLVAPAPERRHRRCSARRGCSSRSCPSCVAGDRHRAGRLPHLRRVRAHAVATVDAAPPDLVTRTAALLHDIAKPPTHVVAADGRHTFYDHPQVGAEMARAILTRWRYSNDEISDVSRLVRLHLRPIQYDRETFSDAAVRRLIRDAGAAPRPDARPRPRRHPRVGLPDARGARRARGADGPPRRRRRRVGDGATR